MGHYDYILYNRSRLLSFLSGTIFGFLSMLVFGWALEEYPNIEDVYSVPLFFGLLFLSYLFSQLTSRSSVKVSVQGDHLRVGRWRRPFSLHPERILYFKDIGSYKTYSKSIKIIVTDKTSYDLCGKQWLFGNNNAMDRFAGNFARAYSKYSAEFAGAKRMHPVTVSLPATSLIYGEEIVTRRSVLFYVSIWFGVLFLGAMVLLMILLFKDEGNILFLLTGAGIAWFLYYLLSRYYRNAPIVKVSMEGIATRGHFYIWSDVTEIVLTGTQVFNIFGAHDLEGTKVALADGSVIIMHDGNYKNLADVRTRLLQCVPEKILKTEERGEAEHLPETSMRTRVTAAYSVPTGGIQYVRGNPFKSVWAITAWGVILILTGLAFYNAENPSDVITYLIIFFFPGAGLFLLCTIAVNHVGISPDAIFIRNVYHPWKRKEFLFANIHEVVLASNHNGMNTIRIIQKNFKTKEYACDALGDADWLEFLTLLRMYGVRVKDENSFEEWSKPSMRKFNVRIKWYLAVYFIVCIVLYAVIADLQISDGLMILTKLGWLLFMILGLISVFVLSVRQSVKDEAEDDNQVE